jgi:hypothetical protein
MREMMLARDARERLGAEARKTATRFSWDSTVDRLDTIYRTVLTGKKISIWASSGPLRRSRSGSWPSGWGEAALNPGAASGSGTLGVEVST